MSKTIYITAKIISLFAVNKEKISLREVSKILSIYPRRVHRFFSSLVFCGFLEKELNHKYRLGEGIFEIGVLYPMHLSLKKVFRSHAEELAKMFKTNVHLAIAGKKIPILQLLLI